MINMRLDLVKEKRRMIKIRLELVKGQEEEDEEIRSSRSHKVHEIKRLRC
jgi:hypothetical protein